MLSQTSPAIWFDSWSNDSRDNNLDGKIDDPSEKGAANPDGSHYGRVYKAQVAPVGIASIDMVPSGTLKTVDVTYKVCIDIPIESYRAAHIQISHNRWIPAFFNEMKHRPGWRVWDGGKRPPSLMFRPSGLNDMVSVSRVLFEAVLRIDFFARWIGL